MCSDKMTAEGTQKRSDFVERSDRHTAKESLSGEKSDRHILQERSDFVWCMVMLTS